MTKSIILITGATDGIGKAAALSLAKQGHQVLLHGRNPDKLAAVERELSALAEAGRIESYCADLSRLTEVEMLADAVRQCHDRLDVLINNAGILKSPEPVTADALDIRFAVNTLAPYLLTRRLLQILHKDSRVINVASAGQAPVDLDALAGRRRIDDAFEAYCQSKLALIMWTLHLAGKQEDMGPSFIAVNPGSLLGTKMVTEGFNIYGKDIGIGANILARMALADEFKGKNGQYYDNDAQRFCQPHPDALNTRQIHTTVQTIDSILKLYA